VDAKGFKIESIRTAGGTKPRRRLFSLSAIPIPLEAVRQRWMPSGRKRIQTRINVQLPGSGGADFLRTKLFQTPRPQCENACGFLSSPLAREDDPMHANLA
jgi:hypothetical protein